MTKRHKTTAVIISAAIILIISVSAFAAQSFFSATPDETDTVTIMPVNVFTAKRTTSFEINRQFTGLIKPSQSSELGFELSGKLESVLVEEGDLVELGQVLATLDTEALIGKQKTATADLARATAQWKEMEAGPRPETKLAAKADVLAAEAVFNNAKSNLNRREKLRDSQSVSAEEYHQAIYLKEAAGARLTAAQQKLAELEAGTRIERRTAAKAAVEQIEAAIEEIDISIGKSQLKAPFAGAITKRFLDPGSIVTASLPILKLQQQSSLEAWVGLPVHSASRLEIAQQLTVTIDDQPFTGTLKAKLLEIDPATRTQTVIVQLPPMASKTVVPGQTCKLTVLQHVDEPGFWVPTTALTQGVRGLWSIMVAEDENGEDRITKRDVEVIHADVDYSLVRGTLVDGDQVVFNGVHRVVLGQRVIIQTDVQPIANLQHSKTTPPQPPFPTSIPEHRTE